MLAKAALRHDFEPQSPIEDSFRKKRFKNSSADTPPLSDLISSQDSLMATPPHKKRKLTNLVSSQDLVGSLGVDSFDSGRQILPSFRSGMSPSSPPSFSMSPTRGESSPPPSRFFSSQESTFNLDDRTSNRMDIALFQDALSNPMKPLIVYSLFQRAQIPT